MSAQTMTLPVVEDIHSLSAETIKQIRRIGFCYVAVPEEGKEETLQALDRIEAHALKFFRDPAMKAKYPVDFEKMAGYADRRTGANPQLLQQLFFKANEPACGFEPLEAELKTFYQCFHNSVGLPLIRKIMASVGLEHRFEEITCHTTPMISFPYYSAERDPSITRGFNPIQILA